MKSTTIMPEVGRDTSKESMEIATFHHDNNPEETEYWLGLPGHIWDTQIEAPLDVGHREWPQTGQQSIAPIITYYFTGGYITY